MSCEPFRVSAGFRPKDLVEVPDKDFVSAICPEALDGVYEDHSPSAYDSSNRSGEMPLGTVWEYLDRIPMAASNLMFEPPFHLHSKWDQKQSRMVSDS